MAAIAELIERIELGQHLRMGLGARRAAVKLDDVAELAGERTAARELHADIEILLELEQIEARDRRLGDVDLEFLRLEQALAVAAIPGGDEFLDDVLGLADDAEIRRGIAMRTRADIGAADDHRQAARAAHIDELERVRLLEQHAAGHDHIGPAEIGFGQFFGVAVDEPDIPGLRQQRRDRDQAERDRRIARADELAGFREIPERIRHELRIDHQHVAGIRPQRTDDAATGAFLTLLFQETSTPKLDPKSGPIGPTRLLPCSMAELPDNSRTKPDRGWSRRELGN